MKSSLVGGIALSVLVLLTAAGRTFTERMVLAAITIISFYVVFILAFYEYDKERTKAWKRKESRLRRKS